MQSTASGKDSVLLAENFPLRRGCFPVCRKRMSSAADLCLLYILYLYGESSPRGASQNGRAWYTAIIIMEK